MNVGETHVCVCSLSSSHSRLGARSSDGRGNDSCANNAGARRREEKEFGVNSSARRRLAEKRTRVLFAPRIFAKPNFLSV